VKYLPREPREAVGATDSSSQSFRVGNAHPAIPHELPRATRHVKALHRESGTAAEHATAAHAAEHTDCAGRAGRA
jgi:hypothetical protein